MIVRWKPQAAQPRVLAAARLIGAGAVAILGQLAVDMPHGSFGPAETVTRFGLV